MPNRLSEWIFLWVIGFAAGVVTNIVVPARRGLVGFAAAAVVGTVCGGIAGLTAEAFEAPRGVQYLLAFFTGVTGDRLISWLIKSLDGPPDKDPQLEPLGIPRDRIINVGPHSQVNLGDAATLEQSGDRDAKPNPPTDDSLQPPSE